MVLAATLVITAAAEAQIGKNVVIRAGTPEDKALQEINAATDPAKKLELLAKFVADFPGDMNLVAYEMYVAHYMAEKDFAKVFDYGEKAMALDADNFSMAYMLMNAALETKDPARAWNYGISIGGILGRYKASPPPAETDAEVWARKKASVLEDNEGNISFVEYTLFNQAFQTPDPTRKAEMLEAYVAAFPDSQYRTSAEGMIAAAYQQMQNFAKMQATAQKVLERDPENLGMLILLSDFWSERGEQLDKAEEYSKKALEVLGKVQKPEQLTDEQWAQQKGLQQGLANSILGQVYIHKNRNADAVTVFRAAAPLLKVDPTTYARNQYRLGFALLNLNRVAEARAALADAASLPTPYQKLAQDKLKTLPVAPAKKRP
jgi:hypothetical protein